MRQFQGSNLFESFNDIFGERTVTEDKRDEFVTSSLIFGPKDIFATNHDLDHKLRTIFVKEGITEGYYRFMVAEFVRRDVDHPSTAGSKYRNSLDALRRGHITFNTFREALCDILGYQINDFIVKVTSPDGRAFDVSMSTSTEVSNKE